MGERPCQSVDSGDNLVALWHGKRPAGAEIVLDIDDQQDISIALLTVCLAAAE